MAINPKIKQKAEDIRSKIFGSEVRESLASGIEAISEDVEATIGRQDAVEQQFQNVIDETTDKDVISAPELIAARNGKSNLKTRLDKEKQEVTAQLQQTMKQEEFDSWVATILDGGPSIFFDTLAALQSAYPSGSAGVALIRETDPAKIYVWNGTIWQDFGPYQGIEIKENTVAWNNLNDSIKIDYPVNLFDKDNAMMDTLFNPTTGEPQTYTGYALSDFIDVELGDTITITNGNASNLVAVYGEAFLGTLKGVTGTNAPYTFTVTNPSAKRIRVNINLGFDDLSKYMVVKSGALPSVYLPYNQKLYEIKNAIVNAENLYNQNKKWANKKVYLFGDSITYWDQRPYWNDENYHIVGYPTYIREELGATTINKAVGGATISTVIPNNINKQVKSITFADADAAIITGGANDIAHGTVVGTIGNREDTTFDTTTYYGSLRDMIHYIYTNNPKTKIYLLAPLPMYDSVTTHFADAMREVGKMYGIPVLSMDWDVQINRQNMATMMFDGVHPNNEGHKVMADAIIPFLKQY